MKDYVKYEEILFKCVFYIKSQHSPKPPNIESDTLDTFV